METIYPNGMKNVFFGFSEETATFDDFNLVNSCRIRIAFIFWFLERRAMNDEGILTEIGDHAHVFAIYSQELMPTADTKNGFS